MQLSQAGCPSPPLWSGRGSHAVFQCGRRGWQEGLLTEGSGPVSLLCGPGPSLVEDPGAPAPLSADGGRPVGAWRERAPCCPVSCWPPPSGLGSGDHWCPWGFRKRESGFLPLLRGWGSSFPPHILYSSLPPLLPSFQVFLSTSSLTVVTAIPPCSVFWAPSLHCEDRGRDTVCLSGGHAWALSLPPVALDHSVPA